MDILSLRDLPLALAFGIVCLWFLNQNNLEFGKKYIALINEFNAKYEAVQETILNERMQWVSDQRADKALLIEVIKNNTEALAKNNHETHSLRQQLTSVIISATPKTGSRRSSNE